MLWVDGLTAALAAGAVAPRSSCRACRHGRRQPAGAIATNVAYPISDLILLGLVVAALAVRGWRVDRTWALAGLGIAAFWVADTHYLVAVANETYAYPTRSTSAGRSVPGPLRARPPGSRRAPRGRSPRTAAPRASPSSRSCSPPSASASWSTPAHGTTSVAVVLAAASMLAVGVRLVLTFRENAGMLVAQPPRGADRRADRAWATAAR